MLLVGTKIDNRENPEVIEVLRSTYSSFTVFVNRNLSLERKSAPLTFEDGMNMKKKVKAVNYLECSALQGTGVADVFTEAIRIVYKHQGVPANHKTRRGCSIL